MSSCARRTAPATHRSTPTWRRACASRSTRASGLAKASISTTSSIRTIPRCGRTRSSPSRSTSRCWMFETKDVHDNFVRLLSPETDSTSSWILRNVQGAAEVMNGSTKTLRGVVIHDPYTVDIYLDEPLAFFLSLLTMNELGIVPVEEMRDPDRARLHPAGAGPFAIAEAIEGERVVLRKNRDYYVPGQPHLDELVFRLDLKKGAEVAEAFVRGELDIAHGIPLKMIN